MHGQIRELLSNYGRIDLLVLDFSYWHLSGEAWRARVLATRRDAIIGNYWNIGVQHFDDPDDLFLNFEMPIGGTYPLPDETDTVIALELATTDAEQAALLALLEAERLAACIERHPNP